MSYGLSTQPPYTCPPVTCNCSYQPTPICNQSFYELVSPLVNWGFQVGLIAGSGVSINSLSHSNEPQFTSTLIRSPLIGSGVGLVLGSTSGVLYATGVKTTCFALSLFD